MRWPSPIEGGRRAVAAAFVLLTVCAASAPAMIDGLTGSSFAFTAKADYIYTADGLSMYMWGYASGDGLMQYPGPTLLLEQGVPVTVTLKNELPEPVSIVFPGQEGVVAAGGAPGVLTREAPPDGTTVVTYTFTPTRCGTFMYYSGTHTDLQVEMGLVGAIIVYPPGGGGHAGMGGMTAFGHHSTAYDREVLVLLTEMDIRVHKLVEFGYVDQVDLSDYKPVYWFLNGRNSPDTVLDADVPWLPTQPYNCMPMIHPGEKMLMRIVGAGRDLHPLHTHGNNMRVLAEDGRLLESAPGEGADLAYSDFTVKVTPGRTMDAIYTWTGHGLGWDIYGHAPGDEMEPGEDPEAHGKPIPVTLPDQMAITLGAMYSGSPFLGAMGQLPPGEGGFAMNGAYMYMWHSHNEREMVNYNTFPGGIMTMLMVLPPWVPIEH